jgi:uncharacterized protein YkwD
MHLDPAREAYNELVNTESVGLLFPKRGLSRAAMDHVEDTGPKGIVSHTGSDGSSVPERMNRYGTLRGGFSENISFGVHTAQGIVVQLLNSTGHRRNIMNRNSNYTGVATGPHSTWGTMCVQKFAFNYIDAADLSDRGGWDIARLDTARNVDYLSDLEKDIILEMNMARSDPQRYAELYINPGINAAARETYDALMGSESLALFSPMRGLTLAARDNAEGRGGSLSERLNRYGRPTGGSSESTLYGTETARGIVIQALNSSAQRRNIMNRDFNHVGIAAGAHATWRTVCVITFTRNFADNN